jgi:hypothetical protein
MDSMAIQNSTLAFLAALVAERLSRANGLAKAAQACLLDDQLSAAAEIAMEIEQPLYEASTALNAIRLINRNLQE